MTTTYQPGETTPEALLKAAADVGPLIMERGRLQADFTRLYQEQFLARPGTEVEQRKVASEAWVIENHGDLYVRLITCESQIRAILCTADVMKAYGTLMSGEVSIEQGASQPVGSRR